MKKTIKLICTTIIIILTLIVLLSTHCKSRKHCHEVIAFINKSPKDVYVFDNGNNDGIPDTSLASAIREIRAFDKVKSNETNSNAIVNRYCFESWIQWHDTGGLNIFILDADVYDNIPVDTIIKYRTGVTTIHPSIEEMESSNWTITYTGE